MESSHRPGRKPLRDYVAPALEYVSSRAGSPVTVTQVARRVKATQGPALSDAQVERTLREMISRGYPVREGQRGVDRVGRYEWVVEGSEAE